MGIFQENPGYTCRLEFPLIVWLISNLKADMSTCPLQNMIPITVLYHLLVIIGDPILFGGFKMDDEVLDQSGIGAIFVGNGEDVDFILYGIHQC